VIQYRGFRNTDPPSLVDIWNEAFTGRGAARLRHASLFERHVFSKPYFDPEGFIVATEDGRVVGFAHAGFGPNQRETLLSRSTGVVCLLAVREAHRRRGVGSELLGRAEAYLKKQGAQVVHAGLSRPMTPFYFGIYGGSDQPGMLASDPAAQPFLEMHGYRAVETTFVFQRHLEQPVNVVDARFANLRRRFDVRIVPRIAVGTWWQEAVLGLIEPVEFRLEEKLTGKAVARATAWEMEAFSCTWNQPSVGILEIHVREELRKQGLGKFLLAQLLRYLQDQYFGLCEVQAAEHNQQAARLFQSVGFGQVDVGRFYRKSQSNG
jgi:ribosomal protein S18 acetylase RimI-like enzyme